jgi:uncharacterized membrane protein
VLLTLLGYLLKAQCIADYNGRRDTHFCVNDFQVLFLNRGLVQHVFPYLHGHYANGNLTGGTVEYPVLTGILAWLPAWISPDDGRYLTASAVLLAPFSFLTALLLFRMSGRRALLYAAAPPLIWYSFHNWDLPVVTATVAAFFLYRRKQWTAASAALAVGAALKLWPGFLVLALLLHRLRARDARGAGLVVASAVGVTAFLNLPFALANFDGWFAPYAFQRDRAADVTSNSIWYWGFPGIDTPTLNVLIPLLLACSFAAAAGYGWWSSRGRPYPFVQVSGAFLCAFMLWNKAHSPQYTLWLLPFFVLLNVRWGWFVAYMGFDACLYFGLFSWYHDLTQGQDFGVAKQATVIGVWGRAVMLVLLAVAFLRAREVVADPVEDQVPSAAPTASAEPVPA